jgi:hypothetical protein
MQVQVMASHLIYQIVQLSFQKEVLQVIVVFQLFQFEGYTCLAQEHFQGQCQTAVSQMSAEKPNAVAPTSSDCAGLRAHRTQSYQVFLAAHQ